MPPCFVLFVYCTMLQNIISVHFKIRQSLIRTCYITLSLLLHPPVILVHVITHYKVEGKLSCLRFLNYLSLCILTCFANALSFGYFLFCAFQ